MTKFEDLTDRRFGKLIVVNRVDNKNDRAMFLCKCDCGKFKEIPSKNLKNGDAKSCGCSRRKYYPSESSAKLVHRSKYSDGNLTFEDFIKLSALNCYYCNLPPSNNRNIFKVMKSKSDYSVDNGNFNYNGLDRLNSNLPHNIDNLITACSTCNKAKSDMSVDDFKNFVKNIYENSILNNRTVVIRDYFKYYNLLNGVEEFDKSFNRKFHPAISTAKKVMYDNYEDGDLNLEKFLELTQYDCFYCGKAPSNMANSSKVRKDSSQYAIENGNFYYNGLDRLDSSKGHDIDNIVACCHSCNWAKGDKSVEEYKEWIIRAYNHIFS